MIAGPSHRYEVTYLLAAGAAFRDYLLAVWNIPRVYRDGRLATNAKEFIWIDNTDGDCLAIL